MRFQLVSHKKWSKGRNYSQSETIYPTGGWGRGRLQINDSSKRKWNERIVNKLHTEISFFIYQIGKAPTCLLHHLLANQLGTRVLTYIGKKGYWLNPLECDFEMPIITTNIHTLWPGIHSKTISQTYPDALEENVKAQRNILLFHSRLLDPD